MVDRKPDLAALARVSYLRELRGDRRGALDALAAAQQRGRAGRRRARRSCPSLVSGLELQLGRVARRALAAREALHALPRLRAGRGGAGRAPTRRRADRAPRSRACAALVGRLPLPEHVTLLAELELARGPAARPRAATSTSCAPSGGCSARRASIVDTEAAVFEADHGDPGRAVALARRAWAARAERALGRRARLGADAGRATRAAGLRWARRALRPRLARPGPRGCTRGSPRPRGRRRAPRPAHGCARRCAAPPALGPWQAARARAALAARRREGGRDAPRAARRSRVLAGAGAAARPRGAHPLGNFTVNRLDVVVGLARPRRRPLGPRPGRDPDVPRARPGARAVLARKRADALRGLRARGRRRAPLRCACWRRAGSRSPPARAACRTTRVELALRGRACATRARVALRDDGERGPPRLARRSSSRPGAGTAVRSDVPSQDVTRGLRAYPKDLLGDPADVRAARLTVAPGARDGHRAARPRRGAADHRRPRRRRRLRAPVRRRGRRARRAGPAAARRGRVGRAARAVARPRQDDGRRLPRRHARDGARTRWRSARRSPSRTRSASSRWAASRSACRSGSCPRTCTRG